MITLMPPKWQIRGFNQLWISTWLILHISMCPILRTGKSAGILAYPARLIHASAPVQELVPVPFMKLKRNPKAAASFGRQAKHLPARILKPSSGDFSNPLYATINGCVFNHDSWSRQTGTSIKDMNVNTTSKCASAAICRLPVGIASLVVGQDLTSTCWSGLIKYLTQQKSIDVY